MLFDQGRKATSTLTRRETLACAAAAVTWATLPAYTAPSGELYGAVVEADSVLGTRHGNSRGIPGVLVSNGVDVVATSSDGHWRLPSSPTGFVFVIKPTGWSLPAGPNGMPAFAQRCTTSIAGPYDFVLYRSVEPTRFDVALLADTQPQNARELGYLRDSILGAVAESSAAFAINHGDVVFDDLTLYPRYLDLIQATGMPWHHCPGNHDMDWNAPHPSQSFETWCRTFGPSYYAFQYGGVTFLVLNNVEPLLPGERTGHGYGYRGRFGTRQLAFVENVLRRLPTDAFVVVSMHIPLVSPEHPDEPSAITVDRETLMQLLSGRPHTLSLAGHTHTTEHHYLGKTQGFAGPGSHHHHVLTSASGGWWSGPYDARGLPVADSRDGTPKGFHLLSIDNCSYTTRFVPVGHAGDPNVRVSIEGSTHASDGSDGPGQRRRRLGCVLSVDECRDAVLVANVFDGGPRTSVTLELHHSSGRNGRPPVAMRQCGMHDPYIVETYCRYKPELKPWLEPTASTHIWTTPMPADLGVGTWRAKVTIADEYGRVCKSSLLFEIVA